MLLTEDKDFGELVYAQRVPSSGVILLRYPASTRAAIAQSVVELANQKGDQLTQSFSVVEPGRVRINPAPGLTSP